MSESKLTPTERAIFERVVQRGPIMELSIISSGGRNPSALQSLIARGLVERCGHPTVVHRGARKGEPVEAIQATEAGKSFAANKQ